jgi:hypothetical protein
MCRWLASFGSSSRLEELLVKRDRLAAGISSPLFFAHIRASTGSAIHTESSIRSS